jgi:hypothetical protein
MSFDLVIVATCTVVACGLASKGWKEKFGLPRDGNFVCSTELLSMSDPFPYNHIEHYEKSASAKPSYLLTNNM